jgi:hypothetical protein
MRSRSKGNGGTAPLPWLLARGASKGVRAWCDAAGKAQLLQLAMRPPNSAAPCAASVAAQNPRSQLPFLQQVAGGAWLARLTCR